MTKGNGRTRRARAARRIRREAGAMRKSAEIADA
jgi:hypothetical protein